MKKAFQKVFSLFNKADSSRKGKARKTRGQSLVEIAIALPFLIILFTGMMEFGFMLNYYLSLLDATREAARFASNADPFITDPASGAKSDDPIFYSNAADTVWGALDPTKILGNESYQGRRLILKDDTDDVIVTVFCVNAGAAVSYPDSGPHRLYGNVTNYLETTSIEDTYISGSPNAGLVLVEVFYSYHPVVGVFYNSPIMLRAHTIMPLNAADPSPVSGCP